MAANREIALVTRAELVAFVRRHPIAVEATLSPTGPPQAAAIGVAVSDDLEIVFDALGSSRKCRNLRRDPRISLVIGWDPDEACTLQLEGIADEPSVEDLDRLKAIYFRQYPDGVDRQTWPGITYVRVRPTWIRFSDYSATPPRIVELRGESLSA